MPDDDKECVTGLMVAHCNSCGEKLNSSTSDVVGAFPRVERPPGSIRLFMRLLQRLPHAWAGGYVEIKGSLYGIKGSSRLFHIEMVKVLKSAGFHPTDNSPMTFLATDPKDVNLKSIASLIVDDIRNLDNCPPLTIRLRDALARPFDEITIRLLLFRRHRAGTHF